MVIYAGDNDLGDGRSAEQVLECFRQLAAKIESSLPGVPYGFISIKLSPARMGIADRIRRANELVRREIECHKPAYFIPIHDAMLDAQGSPRAEFFLGDGLHLNLAGYRLWEQILSSYRNRIFTPISEDCNKVQLSLNNSESGVQKVV
jgi:lysophospholipase L1-like esterase